MGKLKKSTKKFARTQLSQHIKQRKQTKGIRSRKKEQINRILEEAQGQKNQEDDQVENDMSVDEFLGGGFIKLDASNIDDQNEKAQPQEEKDGEGEEDEEMGDNPQDHKQHLQLLQQKDPDFYKFLQQSDQELLQFNAEDGKDDDEEDDNDAEDEGQHGRVITSEHVKFWCQQITEQKSFSSMIKLLKVYRSACRYGEVEDEQNYSIASSAVYNQVVIFVVKEYPIIFESQLGGDLKLAPKSNKWKKLQGAIKSYIVNTLYLVDQLTDGPLIEFCLYHLRRCVPILEHLHRFQHSFLKVSCNSMFGGQQSIQALLLLKEMALKLPHPALDKCLRAVYSSYCKYCGHVNKNDDDKIRFMGTCLVEIYSLDVSISYQYAFDYLKQLAIVMRRAMSMKNAESYREVYCWKFQNCLEVWVRIVAANWREGLEPLIHPVVQLLLGSARLVPSPKYFPIRFRMVKALNFLSQATGVYVPLSSLLLDVFQWGDLFKSAAGGGNVCDFQLQLKINKNSLKSSRLQQQIVNESIQLLSIHLAQWSCSVAFPEMCHIPLVFLRKFMKTTRVEKFKSAIKKLIDAINKTTEYVSSQRNRVNFTPQDVQQVSDFLKKEYDAKELPIQKYLQVAIIKQAGQETDKVILGADNNQDEITIDTINVIQNRRRKDDREDVVEEYQDSDDGDDEVE